MDWLTFISNVISALAWPAVVVVAAYFLRDPVKSLIKLITKLKYGELELSFERKIEKLEQSASGVLPPDTAPANQQKALLSPEIAALAESSPRAAIVEAWIQVSNAAIQALKRKGVQLPPGKSLAPLVIERYIGEAGLLTKDQLALLRQLRNTRNAAVHGSDFKGDAGTALSYVSIARQLTRHLEVA